MRLRSRLLGFVKHGPGGVAPSVASVSPTQGPIDGGTAITVTGTGFVSGATVRINGRLCTSIVVVDATTITCVTPSYPSAVDATLVVRNPSGQQGVLVAGYEYLISDEITVTGVSPSTGPEAGGTTITITGNNFYLVDASEVLAVTIGAVFAASFVVIDASTIEAVTPAGLAADGALDVGVQRTDFHSDLLEGAFTYESSVYDIAALPWKVRLEPGDYDDATPLWTGTASAGTSGTYDLADSGGYAPPAASIVGLDVPDFDGAADYISKATGQNLNGAVSAAAGTVAIAFRADAAVATAGAAYLAAVLFGDDAPYFAVGFDASGVRVALYDGASWKEPTAIACSTGDDHVVVVKWDSTDVYISLDGGAWNSTPSGALAATGYPIQIGRDYSHTSYLDGRILAIWAGSFACDDTEKDGIVDYAQAQSWWGT